MNKNNNGNTRVFRRSDTFVSVFDGVIVNVTDTRYNAVLADCAERTTTVYYTRDKRTYVYTRGNRSGDYAIW